MEDLNPGKVFEEIQKFVQSRNDSKIHYTPLIQCRCKSHLQAKIKDPAWLTNITKELERMKDQGGTHKINIKLNPETRNKKIQL